MATKQRHCPFISLPPDFHFDEVDGKYSSKPPESRLETSLGVLTAFSGTYAGIGFNMIFRPNNSITPTAYPEDFTQQVTPFPGTDAALATNNVLELNVTSETLTFTQKNIGNVPNRGLNNQGDIFLAGAAYVHCVSDTLNPASGKNDNPPTVIHLEPGLWMQVPASQEPQNLPATLTRMGSIPHGVTINANGLNPGDTIIPGPPNFTKVLNPVPSNMLGGPIKAFNQYSLQADFATSPRIPQDLSHFISNGIITQDMMNNPIVLLQAHNEGKNITGNYTFNVSASGNTSLGSGAVNIGFLAGLGAAGGNADVSNFQNTFWIETVMYDVPIPVCKAGESSVYTPPAPPPPSPPPALQLASPVPSFLINPPRDIETAMTISMPSIQIQYSQTVDLLFASIIWPHLSVATLVPQDPIPIPESAYGFGPV